MAYHTTGPGLLPTRDAWRGPRAWRSQTTRMEAVQAILLEFWGGGGVLHKRQPNPHPPTHPTHIAKLFLGGKMKFIKGAQNRKPIGGTKPSLRPLTPADPPPPRPSRGMRMYVSKSPSFKKGHKRKTQEIRKRSSVTLPWAYPEGYPSHL